MIQLRVMSSSFWFYILLPVAIYGGISALLYFSQEGMIFYPDLPGREVQATPENIGLSFEEIFLTTEDNVRLHGWFIPAQSSSRVVLFFHGNAGNISHRLDTIRLFHSMGLGTMIIDYRGYGRSQGKISEQGTYYDAEAVWRYLTDERKIPAKNIVIFGRSLGGSIAAYLASRKPAGALIVESAFISVPDMAAKIYPIFPVRVLSRYEYSTEKYVKAVSCPVLIVHSRDDDIIPFEHGQQLFASSNKPKSFLEIRGGHNEGFFVNGKLYRDGLQGFLSTIQ